MSTIPADAVVIGAGPAGSTAAALLAERGHRVVLVDKTTFPRDKPCGDYCDPGAQRTLQDLGWLQEVVASGAAAIGSMRVVAQTGKEFDAPFPAGHGLLIPRRRLDAVLVQRAVGAGIQLIERFQATALEIHNDAVVVRAEHPHLAVRARLAIAADGMRSVIARRLGLLRSLPAGRFTVGAYFSNFPASAPRGELHLGPHLYGGVAHFGDGAANVCLALPRSMLRRHSPKQAFAEALRHLPVLAEMMAGARRESAFRCTGPVGFASRGAVAQRVLLAGDAAGQIEPMTGQGIYLALRSAILAAETAATALDAGDFSRQVLEQYERRRAAEFSRKILTARLLHFLAFRPSLGPFLIEKLAIKPALASRLLGVTGDVLAPQTVMSPSYLVRLLWGSDANRP